MKYFYLPLVFALLIVLPAKGIAQTEPCGTQLEDANLPYLRELNRAWQRFAETHGDRIVTSISFVPIQLHIVRTTAGTNGISVADFTAALDRVNEQYLDLNIHFYQCNPINYVDDDNYYNYDYSEMAALDAAHSVANVINIYSSENVNFGATPICGHAQFPGGLDFIMLANSCTRNGGTFSHELGHYFNLYHTHETFYGAELVNGSNCTSAGDLLCDTPADPSLSGNVNQGCIYTGVATDGNGATYSPSTINLMSYSTKECRFDITSGQAARALFTLNNSRTYLTCGTVLPLNAEFYSGAAFTCNNSLSVQFADASGGNPTGWSWDFGDGTPLGLTRFPLHNYAAPGTYSVSLTVTRAAASDVITKSQLVHVGPVSVPFTESFESGPVALGNFGETREFKNYIEVSATGAKTGSYGLVLDGFPVDISAYFNNPTTATAFNPLQNPFFKSKVELCVDATALIDVTLDFDLKQLYRFQVYYSNFRVTVNGTAVSPVYQATGAENWQAISIDLSAYAGTVFTLAFEGSHKYNDVYLGSSGAGTATLIDNISLSTLSTLPVEYVNFDAEKATDAVRLDWATYQEVNNDYFEILRSVDANNWTALSRIAGKGKPERGMEYEYFDREAPLLGRSVLYYQLRQVDLNGDQSLSEIRSVAFAASDRISLYPNPVTEDWLQIRGLTEGQYSRILLRDQLGRVLATDIRTASGGNGLALRVSQLPQGVYYLSLTAGGQRQNFSFLRN